MFLNDVVFHDKNARQKCFVFNQILKLTIKNYSNLSNVSTC